MTDEEADMVTELIARAYQRGYRNGGATLGDLVAAAIAFEQQLSTDCDGPFRDRLREAIAKALA